MYSNYRLYCNLSPISSTYVNRSLIPLKSKNIDVSSLMAISTVSLANADFNLG